MDMRTAATSLSSNIGDWVVSQPLLQVCLTAAVCKEPLTSYAKAWVAFRKERDRIVGRHSSANISVAERLG